VALVTALDPPPPPTGQEREEWRALVAADTLALLPDEALIASIKSLAERLLELAILIDAYRLRGEG
jgi:hypothetical protein